MRDQEQQSASLIDSVQDWQSLLAWRPSFPSLIAKWRRAIALLSLSTQVTDDDLVGQLIITFMTTSVIDVDDLMLLTVHNKHVGAHKILRAIFERVVTLKYIAENPGEAERFMDYDAIDCAQVLDGIQATIGITLEEPALSRMRNAAAKARKKYRSEPCLECGMRKQTSWTKLSNKDMAARTDLGHMYFHAFLTSSKLIHPTYWGTREAISKESPIYNTMNYLHELMVQLILLHRRHFVKGRDITPMMSAAVGDFLAIWIFAETSFGGMLTGIPSR
jgi:hypothetical protein